ncbi:MAG TPA: winged helix-turn-helix domain-containing protein [Egibacteraceae bacterium]|nr:winged helix-turn-helix domain-containing protein [Egibacteraceae bacterium]
MTVPDFQTIMRPVLVTLGDGMAHSMQSLRASVAEALNVSEEDQAELLASGKQTRYSNRVGWALTHMAKAGLVERPARGEYSLSARGKQVLEENPDRVDMNVLFAFPEYQEFRTPKVVAPSESSGEALATAAVTADLSPSEAMESLVKGADAAVAGELLERILAQPPAFLERLGLRLLAAMGYGGRESLTEHTGKSGDAGLDGLVRQDALGLELIGLQAKRYEKDSCVNRPEIQAFVGALQGAQTSRGVFVTTGRFSAGARQFAEAVAMRLILLDGEQLTRAMVRYNVGVSARETFELKQVDEDFFDE